MLNEKTYDELKSDIHVSDVMGLSTFNCELNHKKSSKGWLIYKDPKGDTLRVKNTKSAYDSFFSNADDPNDKGDLLKFVASRMANCSVSTISKQDIRKAIVFLNELQNPAYKEKLTVVSKKRERFTKKRNELAKAYSKQNNTVPMSDFDLLVKKRGISLSVLKQKNIRPTLFNTFYKQDNGKIYTNTVFAGLEKDGSTRSMEMILESNAKRQLLDQTYPWHSIVEDRPKIAIISESAIDALSYYELHKEALDEYKETLLISTGGQVYDTKLNNISKLLDQCKADKNTRFISATDNDKKGMDYDMELTVFLMDKYHTPTKLDNTTEYFNVFKFDKIGSEVKEKLISFRESYNDRLEKEDKQDPTAEAKNVYGNFIVTKEDQEKNSFDLYLPKSINSLSKDFNNLLDCFSDTRPLYVHKAATDWNDTLKMKKGIDVPKKQTAKKDLTENNIQRKAQRI